MLSDFLMGGKPTQLLLGENQLTVQGDFKNAAAALDQGWLDAVLLLEISRQTGSLGIIVSDDAVFDFDRHGSSRLVIASI